MNHLYPIFLNLAGREVLVVGAGKVAVRKVRTLTRSGAKVTVVAPRACDDMEQLRRKGLITLAKRGYTRRDLNGKWLVIAATGDAALNAELASDAENAGVFCNVVDRPDLCSFQVPAVARRGPLQLAVSTAGVCPLLAKRIRRRLEQLFGPEYEKLLEELRALRQSLRKAYPSDPEERRRRLASFLDERAVFGSLNVEENEALLADLEQEPWNCP